MLREDTAALVERLTGLPLTDAGFRWAGWRSMRRKQVMREIDFAARASDTHSPDFEADAHDPGGAAHGAGGGAHGALSGTQAFGGGAHAAGAAPSVPGEAHGTRRGARRA